MTIRAVEERDVDAVVGLVHELAEYERAAEHCLLTAAQLHAALFGPAPALFGHVAEVDGSVVGCALWFLNFSTWRGVHGLYLEDLYVQPAHRGAGLGRALLARLAGVCAERGLARLEWSVLDWNAPVDRLLPLARAPSRWTSGRCSGSTATALEALGREAEPRSAAGSSSSGAHRPRPRPLADQQHERREHDHAGEQPEQQLARRPDQRVDHRQQQELGDDRGRARPAAAGQQSPGDRPERHGDEQEEPGLAEHRGRPRSASPARTASTTVNAAARERLQPDQHPGQAHGCRRGVAARARRPDTGAVSRRGHGAARIGGSTLPGCARCWW